MCKRVSSILAEIDGDRTVRWSLRKVMCHLFHFSEATASRVLSGESSLDIEQYAELARHLDDDYDDRRLSDCFHGQKSDLAPRPQTFVNGRIDDDIADLDEAKGHLITAYRAGDRAEAKAQWHVGSEAWANVLGEIERLLVRQAEEHFQRSMKDLI